MNLREKFNIIKVYIKNAKKSISSTERIDLFIVLAVLMLVFVPIFVSLGIKVYANIRQIDMYLSYRFEEFFGEELTEKLLTDFNEKNPDLRIRLLAVPNKKNREPDVLIFDEVEFSGNAAEGLVSLRIFSDSDEIDREQLALPLVSFMDLLFYSVDILQAAGFDRPPKTREEFFSIAKAVSEGSFGAVGTAICLNPDDKRALSRDVFSWIWAAGNDLWTGEDGPVINSRAIINDIFFFGRLYREGILTDFDMTGDQQIEEFAQGKIAMMIASTGAIPSLRKKMGEGSFGITDIPGSGSGAQYSICLDSLYAGINADTKHPDEAWRFLEFLTEQSPLLCAELKAVPGIISDIIPGDYIKDDPFYSKARDIFELSKIVWGFSGLIQAEEFENIFREEMLVYFETGRTERDTVTAIQKRWDEVPAKNDDIDDTEEAR